MDNKIIVPANDNKPEDKDQPDLESLLVLMRLLVGGAAEGVDELIRRLKEGQAAVNQDHLASMTIFRPDETGLARFRYALIGLMFEAPEQIVKRISTVRQSTQRAAHLMDRLFSPVTNSPLMRPIRRRHQAGRAQLEARVERLIEIGRGEEQRGRRLARETAGETMDEFFDYLAQNPELRQVLQQQSVGLTNEAVAQLRQRSAEADRLIDRLAGAILKRPAPPDAQGSAPPDDADLPASPAENQRYSHE